MALGSSALVAQTNTAVDHAGQMFQDALSVWLQDDESVSLPMLAELARGGNSAARLLLGHIDKTPALQGPWLTNLPRAARIALLRAEGGLSGRNWITVDADQNDMARLWTDLWQGGDDLSVARAFAAKGDGRAVIQTLLAHASRQQTPFSAQLVAEPWFPQGLIHMSAGWGMDAALLARLPAGDPQRAMLGPEPDADARAQWLATAPEAAALRSACATQCPETETACRQALLTAFPVYQSLLGHGSPDAGLLSDARFAQSAKGQASLARRIMQTRAARLRQSHLTKVAAQDVCAADWLRSEYARYDLPVPPAPKAPE